MDAHFLVNKTKVFVKVLINLTNKDKIVWERAILNIHKSAWNNWKFYTELLQDEQPVLELTSPSGEQQKIQSYGFFIEELNSAIVYQYKRNKRYEFSDEYLVESRRQEKVREGAKDERQKSLDRLISEFSENLKE